MRRWVGCGTGAGVKKAREASLLGAARPRARVAAFGVQPHRVTDGRCTAHGMIWVNASESARQFALREEVHLVQIPSPRELTSLQRLRRRLSSTAGLTGRITVHKVRTMLISLPRGSGAAFRPPPCESIGLQDFA